MMRIIAASRTITALPAGEPKIVRAMSPTWRPRPKWALSPLWEVPGVSLERSFTVPSTLPRFDIRIPPKPRRRSQSRAFSKGGADDFGGSAQEGHRVLVEARAGTPIHAHAAHLLRPQRWPQNDLARRSAADLEAQRGRIGPAQRIAQDAVKRRHPSHLHSGSFDPFGR